MPTVALTGASSQLGIFLLPRLQAAGYRVDAYSRRVKSGPVQVSGQVRWLQPGGDSGPAAAVVSCGPLALARQMVLAGRGLERVVAFSTSSVLTKADSGSRAERSQMADIRADEDRLKSACAERGVGLLLIRPTLIYGCGLDRNISLLARFGKRFGFIPVAGQARGLRQPVHADDLAALAVAALGSEAFPAGESPACGGSTLGYRDMVSRVAACFEGIRVVSVSPRLLAAAAGMVSRLPAYRAVNAEMVRRQASDLVFDDSPLRKALHFGPRPFRPGPGDFEIPLACRRLQLG